MAKLEGKIRVMDIQISMSCVQPSPFFYSKSEVFSADSISPDLLRAAQENEEEESQKEYFNGGHLGTIIEHEDFPATIASVEEFPEPDLQFELEQD